MNIIKGFALNRVFVDNTPGGVSDIGQLAPIGYTSCKEPNVYSSQTYPTVSMVHFPGANDGVGVTSAIPDDQKEHILKVISAIYAQSLSSTSVQSPITFLNALLNTMGAEVANVSVGNQVVAGQYSCVEWVQWNNPAVDNTNINKIWFSSNAFVGQYDESDFTVVLPFTPADLFFGKAADVKTLLASRTITQMFQQIEIARNNSPETDCQALQFNYVNPLNANDKTPATFAVLIYGAAGDNLDLIKQAIINALMNGSQYTRDQWKAILPDLFLRTEFLMFPQWQNLAIENILGGPNGINSPVSTIADLITEAQNDSGDYNPAYVAANLQVLTFPYQSISIGCIGNTENTGGKNKLTNWFPDYFFTPNTSVDFNRMSLDTQGWFNFMATMLPIARDLTQSSTLPLGYSRVVIGNRLFLVNSYDGVDFKIAAPGVVSAS